MQLPPVLAAAPIVSAVPKGTRGVHNCATRATAHLALVSPKPAVVADKREVPLKTATDVFELVAEDLAHL